MYKKKKRKEKEKKEDKKKERILLLFFVALSFIIKTHLENINNNKLICRYVKLHGHTFFLCLFVCSFVRRKYTKIA